MKGGRIFEKIFDGANLYGKKAVKMPVPEFYVFYNGAMDLPEEQIIRLSDLFLEKAPENTVEVVVKRL